MVKGDQEIGFFPDSLDRSIFDPDIHKAVPAPDSRFHILRDEDVIAVSREDLSSDGADGLHALAGLASDPDTHIYSHRLPLFLMSGLTPAQVIPHHGKR
jgi:hypothetical protein